MPASTEAGERRGFAPKWYLNGFPRSGLHLVALMLEGLGTKKQEGTDGLPEGPWAGTFTHNAWSNEWMPLEMVLPRIGNLQHYHYMKAHAGYTEFIDRFLYYLGVCHIFIYRDFRDVAVSQAHFIMSQPEGEIQFADRGDGQEMTRTVKVYRYHPGRALYEGMSFDEVLAAVIIGTKGPSISSDTGVVQYPGVMERWELYAPWLERDWVYKVRFEDARQWPEMVAEGMIRYGFTRWQMAHLHDFNVYDDRIEGASQAMAASSRQRERSVTFRKGEIGGWREAFTERHKRLFKQSDVNGWLVRLGYEASDDW